ncbi:MAG TPA: hypothetical protein VMH83_16080 [Candidatus Acidoferrum sp.]|nr:hypothetical protein [Candidatus Acidoferrum sp.]
MQDYESFTLATGDGRWSLELVPAFGGVANKLVYTAPDGTQTPLIAGHGNRAGFEQDRYFRGVPLYPFINRLRDGRYLHEGREYRFRLNEPASGNSLHGFLFTRPPQVEDVVTGPQIAEATLVWHYAGDVAAYPFPAQIRLQFRLHSEAGVSVTFRVRNFHATAVPLAIGWHPYFTLGVPVDELMLQLPPAQRTELDARQLPTGRLLGFERFTKGGRIGDIRLDDCFELQATVKEHVTSRLWSPATGFGIELWQRVADYPLLQVFIPPDRRSIALEPVSGGIDCFNTGRHLRLLGNGDVFAARCGVRIMQAIP